MKDKEKTPDFDIWQIISWLLANVPVLQVNRDAFLKSTFKKRLTKEEIEKLLTSGPKGVVELEDIDKIATSLIGKQRLTTTGISVLTGLPSNVLALAGTITADVLQTFAFYIIMAQQLAYLYGEDDFWALSDDDQKTRLMLYIGTMFGIEKAASLIPIISKNAAEILAKRFMETAVTKVLGGIPWKIAKVVARLLGIKLTRDVAAKGISKIVPIIGGIASGALNYATFGPMAKKLNAALRESWTITPDEIESRIDTLCAEDLEDIIIDIGEDIIEGVIVDAENAGQQEDLIVLTNSESE
jgi:hypothetical protein